MGRPPALACVASAYVTGGIPFSNVMARRRRGVDLRRVGSGTVSGTSLYRVAGFGPLALAGVCDVAKGAVGPLLAGPRDQPAVAALAAGAAVAGHNWSPFLRGAGGRGISPAIGAMLATAPAGAVVLLAGLVGGRWTGETAIGSLVADAALVPVAGAVHGRRGAMAAAAVVVPMLVKRMAGNAPARSVAATPAGRRAVLRNRILYDRDTRTKQAA